MSSLGNGPEDSVVPRAYKNHDRRTRHAMVNNHEAGKQSRQNTTLNIRKKKKEDRLQQRRAAPLLHHNMIRFEQCHRTPLAIVNDFVERVGKVPQQGLGPTRQLVQEIRDVRRATQVTDQPQLEAFAQVFFQQGGQNALVNVLRYNQLLNDEVIHEATWISSNLSALSSRWLKILLFSGIMPVLVPFVTHELAAIRLQVLWCLGIIAQSELEFRDHLFNNQAIVDGLLQNLQNPMDVEVLKSCLWTIANCLRMTPQPSSQLAQLFVPHILTLFNHEVEQEGRLEVLSALLECVLQLADCELIVLESMFREQKGILSNTMVQFAKKYGYRHQALLHSVSAILDRLTSVDPAYAEQIVGAGLLDEACMSKFLESRRDCLLVKTFNFLANIAAVAKLNGVLVRAAHVRRNLVLASRSPRPWGVRVKAWRVMVNILAFGTKSDVITMCSETMMIRSLCHYLSNAQDDHALTVDLLEAVHMILLLGRDGETLQSAMDTFGRCNLHGVLMKLLKSESDEVYDMVDRVLNVLELEEDEDDEEDQNCAPAIAADQQNFVFGLPKQPSNDGVPQKLPHSSQHNSPLGVLLERN